MSTRFELIQGDCLDVMQHMKGGCVDVIITSPPYNLGISSGGGMRATATHSKWSGGALRQGYRDYEDGMPDEQYVEWQKACLLEMWRLLSDKGAIFYNHKPRIQNLEVQLPTRFNPDLPLRQVIIWDRKGGVNFTPANFLIQHEWIMVLAKPDFRLKSQAASGIGDVWSIPPESNNTHPAPFPVALPLRILQSLPDSLTVVFDPFLGSGSTLIAAAQTGRTGIGVDLTQSYLDLAGKRIKAAERQSFLDLGDIQQVTYNGTT